MQLYFAPLACSLATRIALYEAGADARFVHVDLKAKRTIGGADFLDINPMGQVPVLELDDGTRLTENTAVLQTVAETFPAAHLAPDSAGDRARLRQWLGFIGTELHKAVFAPLLEAAAPAEAKAHARSKIERRFGVLDRHLDGREFLLDRFSVADAYLTTILNWCGACQIDLAPWPALADYQKRIQQRPHVARAVGEEFAMYRDEQKAAAR